MTDVEVRPKRKTIRACDVCAKKKIRCDGIRPCSNCVNYKTQCIFTHVERQRKTPQRSARRIDALEDRLGQLEASLTRSGLFTNQKPPSHGTTTHIDQSGDREEDGPVVIPAAPSLAENGIASSTKSPSSSGQAERTDRGAAATASINIDTDRTSDDDKPEHLGRSTQDRVDLRLPPPHKALSLIEEFFDKFNCVFPLFHQSSFMRLIEKHYTRERGDRPEFWAALNVALALAHRLRAMSSTVAPHEDAQAWGYLRNALHVVPELTLRNPNLLGVQAILGMAVILQGTPNPQPASTLVASAIRMSLHLGLHQSAQGLQCSSVEKEQRVRVFWTAYILDKDFSLQLCQPPLLHDDDLSIDLPSEQPEDGLGYIHSIDRLTTINFFRMRVLLAIIEGRIYNKLYSSKAQTQSPQGRLQAVQHLGAMLDNWKHSIPFEFGSDHLAHALPKRNILHLVILHLSYFNCLTTLHSVSLQNTEWTTGLIKYSLHGSNADPSNPSHALCVSAARASMHLIHLIPRGNYACIWLLLCYYVSGLVVLLANILHSPEDSVARSDMQLIKPLLRLLDSLQGYSSSTDLRRMRAICSDLESRAMTAIDTLVHEDQPRPERKRSVEATGDEEIVPEELILDGLNSRPPGPVDLHGRLQEEGRLDHEAPLADTFVGEDMDSVGWQQYIEETTFASMLSPDYLHSLDNVNDFSIDDPRYN